MTVNIIITLLLMVFIIVMLFQNVSSPGTIFMLGPIAACALMGYSPKEINGFIGSGLQSVGGTLFLMVTAVLYFGILHEAGVFKALVKFVMGFLGNRVSGTLAVTAIISFLTQLDGSGATTALCTIPTMKPIFEKEHIRKESLLLVESLASGIFCLLPWAPGLVEASSYVGVEAYDVFLFLIPLIVFSVILLLLLCVFLAVLEKRRGAGLTDEEVIPVKAELDEKLELPLGTKAAVFDGVFTLVLMALLLAGKLPSNVGFGFGLAVLLLVNFHSGKAQTEYMKRQAYLALNMAFTMLGVAVLVGVNNGTNALGDLAVWISQNIPAELLGHLPVFLCLLSMLLSITLGSAKNSMILPAVIPLVTPLGFDSVQVVGAVFATGVISANLSLFNASPYLALGLAGVDMKDHLKYSLLPVYGFSLAMTAFMLITGMLSF